MRTSRPHTLHLIGLTVILTVLSVLAQAQDSLSDNDGRLQVLGGPHLVRFANGDLTVKVTDVSLHELLEEIARQSGLTVVRYVALDDERMTLEFHQLSLQQGLRRILRHRSFLLEYAQQSPEERLSAAVRPKTLWILPQGEENDSVQSTIVVDTNDEASGDYRATQISRLQAALSGEQPRDREEAVLELGESGRADAVPTLGLALGDENEDVREAAIFALVEIGGPEAAQAMSIALANEDPKVRAQAVDALGEIGGELAMGLLEQALADDEHSVREAAAEILDELRSTVQ